MKWNQNFIGREEMEKNKLIKITDKEYFAVKALSNSGVKKINSGTPANFNLPEVHKECFTLGRAFHTCTLEPELVKDKILFAEEGKKRTSKQIQDGYLKFKDVAEIQNWANSLREYKLYGTNLGNIFDNCKIEMANFWDQDFDGFTVPCKQKIDAISYKYGLIIDAKSAKDASGKGFFKALYTTTMYYIQAGFYRLPEEFRDFGFLFAVVEKEPPYSTATYLVDNSCMEKAYNQIYKAARIWYDCMERDEWTKQYNNEPQILPAPKYL